PTPQAPKQNHKASHDQYSPALHEVTGEEDVPFGIRIISIAKHDNFVAERQCAALGSIKQGEAEILLLELHSIKVAHDIPGRGYGENSRRMSVIIRLRNVLIGKPDGLGHFPDFLVRPREEMPSGLRAGPAEFLD